MTRAILLTLRGPFRSWGTASGGDDRPTEFYPTASAVLGLAGACMGVDSAAPEQVGTWNRAFEVCTISATSYVQKIDSERQVSFYPELLTDYQTTRNSLGMDGKFRATAIESLRGYVTDGLDVAAVVPRSEEADGWLTGLSYALQQPRFTPYMGRRSNPFSTPPVEPGEGVINLSSMADLCERMFSRLSGLRIGDLSPSTCLLRLPSSLVEQEGEPGEKWIGAGQSAIADLRSGPLRTFENRLVYFYRRQMEQEDLSDDL